MVQQYLEHSRAILGSESSRYKFNERRGVGRIYLFGYQNRYDLSEGLPLLTTKELHFDKIAHELIWFLRGDTNIKYLVDNGVHIWDSDAFNWNLKRMVSEGAFQGVGKDPKSWAAAKKDYIARIKKDAGFAQKWGDLGPVYGSQWVHWPSFVPIKGTTLKTDLVDVEVRDHYLKDPNGIDQIAETIRGMKKDPLSARYIITAWNPNEVPNMALPPCHTMFQLNSDGKRLDLQLYQRACDMFLGVPFNIASYAMMNIILAQQIGLQPGEFVHTFGDVHFYTGAGERAEWYRDNFEGFRQKAGEAATHKDFGNLLGWLNERLPPEPKGTEGKDHVPKILEQLTREPRQLPKVTIKNKPYNELTIDDFMLEGYNPHPKIEATLSAG